MVALSSFLRKRCSQALTDSHLVDSKGDLENIFTIPELYPHKSSIPEADNSKARVENTVTMLLDLNSEEEGPHLFLVFLRTVIYLSGFPETNGGYKRLSECCALVEIEHVLTSMGNESEYDMRDVAALVEHFHNHPYVDDNMYGRVLSQIPPDIVGKVRKRLPEFDIPAVVRIFISGLSTPDGAGQLAWALYQLNHETEAWQELDSLLRNLYKVDVTYARLQQLQSLLQPMELPTDVLSEAYRASVPEASDIPAGDKATLLPMMLSELGKLPHDADNILPVTEFAARLALYAKQQHRQSIQKDIESWIEARVRESGKNVPQYMNALHTRLQVSAPATVAYLLIVVEPRDEQTFEIRAWLLDDQNQPAEKTEPYASPNPVPSTHIPGCISEIRRKYAAYLSRDLIIEVFLPYEDLLCCAIDHWLIGNVWAKRKFGLMHRLVVRSLERAQNILVLNVWKQKWNVFQQFIHNDRLANDIFWLCEEQDYRNGEALFGVLNGYDIVCLAMGFVPSPPEETDILAAILEAGIPIVLWPRVPMRSLEDSFNKFKGQLKDLFQSPQELLNLPEWVFKQRVEAGRVGADHHGHHLTLLWDDPNRLPPDIAGEQFVYQR